MEAEGGRRRRRKRRRTWLARNTTVLHRSLVAYIRRAGDEFPRSTHDWPVMRQEFPTFSGGYRCSLAVHFRDTPPPQNTFPLMLPTFSYRRRLLVARSWQLRSCDLRRSTGFNARNIRNRHSDVAENEDWGQVSVSNERHFGTWNF